MSILSDRLQVRAVMPGDASCLCAILNDIINVGGTTALEAPLTTAQFNDYFLEGEQFLNCFVAEDRRTTLIMGFQALGRHPELPEHWADIATFARIEPKMRGIGSILFEQTREKAKELALAAINAAIRADNQGGLAYYEKMGFRTYKVEKAVPLRDGTPVDRIFKRYVVGS